MERDLDFGRQLMTRIEQQEGPKEWSPKLPVDAPDKDLYHLELLMDEGFVLGTMRTAGNANNPLGARVERLTWKGHEFLEVARTDTVWNKVKGTMKEKGLGAIYEVAKQLAIEYAKSGLVT